MRILGIDYGQKRIGIAISDEMAIVATPVGNVEENGINAVVAAIAKIVTEREVGKIVVGLPRNRDGSLGAKAQETLAFVEKLKTRVTVPIQTWDERLTTKQAERAMIEADVSRKQRRASIDKMAAQLILQSFLDSQQIPCADEPENF
jgi:putative Holliday junction resolvase